MGNALGLRSRRSVRVMTVDGATFKLRPPCCARDAVSGRGEGYAVMESEDVKRHGVHARRLDPDTSLKPGKIYFLVHLPKPASSSAAFGGGDQEPRRVQSGIQVSAKERLEGLMLARRRAVSDITSFARVAAVEERGASPRGAASGVIEGGVRVTMRLPRAEVKRLVRESADSTEAARKIAELARSKISEAASSAGAGGAAAAGGAAGEGGQGPVSGNLSGNLSDCSSNLGAPGGRKKKMRFSPLQPEIIG